MSECIQISFAVCRIGIYTVTIKYPAENHQPFRLQASFEMCGSGFESSMKNCFRAFCCKGPPPPRPEFDLVCIGLTGSGKTSLLTKLCGENVDNVVSTTGFSIKAVPLQGAVMNIKELGGADNIRKYWSRYYQGSQGVIFVIDSASSEEELEVARNELHSALQHPQLCTLPFLILANHQDKPAARSVQEMKKYLELEPLARGKRWILQPCSLDDMDAVRASFALLINSLEDKNLEVVRM
ncbi:ADP-ribosylation factor-like protein 15 isoform X2 [Monodelphis domestica]|nr:ADP-ribosylation factor-like protein 15 isoform X2 [Monodelphis domestica]XP_016286780.1 ADP-ribosylation factor-like protein 15 isoform X2 [Monodelphis domestica]XP_016286782.1 ADP-ribosylation factor-like protein 15 isoform X2 [Monodelphis domestica]XP_056680895.1 ADP-ribosylation factor-like protein 15 isoform X2 [Monodelphis domestica]